MVEVEGITGRRKGDDGPKPPVPNGAGKELEPKLDVVDLEASNKAASLLSLRVPARLGVGMNDTEPRSDGLSGMSG